MPTHDRVEIVRFTGGELSGLVVEAPQDLAEQLPFMKLAVTAAGQLLDVTEQCRLRYVRVLQRPGARQAAPPTPAARRVAAQPTTQPPPVRTTPRRPAVSMAPVFLAPRPAQ